jgi:hypothetical protein
MQWPSNIPPDLRDRLDSVMDARSYGAADIWGAVKEWLENPSSTRVNYVT